MRAAARVRGEAKQEGSFLSGSSGNHVCASSPAPWLTGAVTRNRAGDGGEGLKREFEEKLKMKD
jgi:hypothetical protein